MQIIKEHMKKTLIIIALVLGTICCTWSCRATDVYGLAREYGQKEGFEVTSVGSTLLGLMKVAVAFEGGLDEEDRAALDIFKGIKNVTVVEFEDASEADKKAFRTHLEKILGSMELILEAKEDGESVRIYGQDDGEALHDILIYCPDDDAIIGVKGSIAMENIGRLMEVAK